MTSGSLSRPFGPTPWEEPLSYPGPWPETSCLLDGDRLVATGAWEDDLADRHAVLAVGSNGSPAQLHRKLTEAGLAVRVPILRVEAVGLAPVFTSWSAAYGALPTTAAAMAGARSSLIVTMLDERQVAAIDATEGGYRRLTLDPGAHPVSVAGDDGRTLGSVSCYVAGTGVLVDPATGEPVVLRPQRELWGWLLDRVPGLVALLGSTPEEAVAGLRRSPKQRAAFAVLLSRAGASGPPRPPATLAPAG